jgi:tol-pal system protein YbgF
MDQWPPFLVEKRKTHFWGNFPLLIFLLLLFACAAQQNPQLDSIQEQISALRVDIEELREEHRGIKRLGADIGRLNEKLEETSLNPVSRVEENTRLLLQNFADSRIQMQELVDEISIIQENFSEHSQVIRNISDQTKILESNLVKQIIKLKAKIEQITPERLYQRAQDFFMNGHYDEAYKTFNGFTKQYPRHALKDNARLFKGESLYRMRKFEKAVVELDLLISQKPKSSLVPAAIYLKAESLLGLEKKIEAKYEFQRLATDYPYSKEAVRAKPRLDSLP